MSTKALVVVSPCRPGVSREAASRRVERAAAGVGSCRCTCAEAVRARSLLLPAGPRRSIEAVEVRVVLDADAEDEDVERLGRQLRNELRSLDVDSVYAISFDEPPPGSKGPVVGAMTEWLVTLSASGGVFATVIATVKDWLSQRAGAHKVVVTIDGDSLELSSATLVEQAELVKAFVQRHASG